MKSTPLSVEFLVNDIIRKVAKQPHGGMIGNQSPALFPYAVDLVVRFGCDVKTADVLLHAIGTELGRSCCLAIAMPLIEHNKVSCDARQELLKVLLYGERDHVIHAAALLSEALAISPRPLTNKELDRIAEIGVHGKAVIREYRARSL